MRLSRKEAKELGLELPPAAPKYKNVRTTVDGHRFDSKKEANRFGVLKLLQQAGKISGLKVHPEFELVVNGERIGVYTADFEYVENGERVVEDVKSGPTKTTAYRLRKRLVKALYGVIVREV